MSTFLVHCAKSRDELKKESQEINWVLLRGSETDLLVLFGVAVICHPWGEAKTSGKRVFDDVKVALVTGTGKKKDTQRDQECKQLVVDRRSNPGKNDAHGAGSENELQKNNQ